MPGQVGKLIVNFNSISQQAIVSAGPKDTKDTDIIRIGTAELTSEKKEM